MLVLLTLQFDFQKRVNCFENPIKVLQWLALAYTWASSSLTSGNVSHTSVQIALYEMKRNNRMQLTSYAAKYSNRNTKNSLMKLLHNSEINFAIYLHNHGRHIFVFTITSKCTRTTNLIWFQDMFRRKTSDDCHLKWISLEIDVQNVFCCEIYIYDSIDSRYIAIQYNTTLHTIQ